MFESDVNTMTKVLKSVLMRNARSKKKEIYVYIHNAINKVHKINVRGVKAMSKKTTKNKTNKNKFTNLCQNSSFITIKQIITILCSICSMCNSYCTVDHFMF